MQQWIGSKMWIFFVDLFVEPQDTADGRNPANQLIWQISIEIPSFAELYIYIHVYFNWLAGFLQSTVGVFESSILLVTKDADFHQR